jgi:Fe-Mn family superoxide dismutase
MAFTLKALPYEKTALAPLISEETINFHYGKHHQAYVNKLNGLIEGTDFENKTLEEIIVSSEGGIFNNAAQVWNHTFYWESLSPKGGGLPKGKIAELINRDFGSFESFKEAFSNASASLFGSGWAWLVINEDGKLEITQESNAGNPLTKNQKALLCCDVWEHAYYLDKQNKRPDYIEDFWKLVDWKAVEERL